MAGSRHLLITGPPGCGKTTVLEATLDRLARGGWSAFGFWTTEVREGRARQGFEARLVSGKSAMMALKGWTGLPRVGSYGVRVEVVEALIVPEIERGIAAAETQPRVVLVMDEIGKMELLSASFRGAVTRAFESRARVIATIMQRPHRFADALKARPDTRLLSVTPGNRDSLPAQIAQEYPAG